MPVLSILITVAGVALVVAALTRRSRRIRIGNTTGNVIAGDVSGTAVQTFEQKGAPQQTRAAFDSRDGVNWAIGGVGLVLTAAGVYLAYLTYVAGS